MHFLWHLKNEFFIFNNTVKQRATSHNYSLHAKRCTKRIRPSPTRLRVELWNTFQREKKERKKGKTEEFWQCVNRIVLPVTELESRFKHLSQVNQGKHVFWALGQLNELPLFIFSLCCSCMLSSSIYWKLWCMCIMYKRGCGCCCCFFFLPCFFALDSKVLGLACPAPLWVEQEGIMSRENNKCRPPSTCRSLSLYHSRQIVFTPDPTTATKDPPAHPITANQIT